MISGEWGIEPSVVMRVFLAVLLGGLIGLERELHGRPAGLRTHVVVCLGAAGLILGAEFTQAARAGEGLVSDPDRMAAGIITGIGFLGAGAILREENLVRGLTTAGCIWFVAALGIVIGKQFYFLAVLLTAVALAVLTLFRCVEKRIPVLRFKDLVIRTAFDRWEEIQGECREILLKQGLEIEDKELTLDRKNGEVEFRLTIRLRKGEDKEPAVRELSGLSGVHRVVW